MPSGEQKFSHVGAVYVADNDSGFRSEISTYLFGFRYNIKSYPNAEQILLDGDFKGPTVVIAEIRMPTMTGLELLKRLRARGVQAPVVLLGGSATPEEIIDALREGAADILLKPVLESKITEVVTRLLERDKQRLAEVGRRERLERAILRLTPRERDVARLVALGLTNKQIATLIKVRPDTVKHYRAIIYEKFRVENFAHFIALRVDPDLFASAGLLPNPSSAPDLKARVDWGPVPLDNL